MYSYSSDKRYGVTFVDGSSGICVTRYYENRMDALEEAVRYDGIMFRLAFEGE